MTRDEILHSIYIDRKIGHLFFLCDYYHSQVNCALQFNFGEVKNRDEYEYRFICECGNEIRFSELELIRKLENYDNIQDLTCGCSVYDLELINKAKLIDVFQGFIAYEKNNWIVHKVKCSKKGEISFLCRCNGCNKQKVFPVKKFLFDNIKYCCSNKIIQQKIRSEIEKKKRKEKQEKERLKRKRIKSYTYSTKREKIVKVNIKDKRKKEKKQEYYNRISKKQLNYHYKNKKFFRKVIPLVKTESGSVGRPKAEINGISLLFILWKFRVEQGFYSAQEIFKECGIAKTTYYKLLKQYKEFYNRKEGEKNVNKK